MTITPLDTELCIPVKAGSIPGVDTTQAMTVVPGAGAPVDLANLLDERTVAVLAEAARAQAAAGGLKLLGADGLLQSITKRVIEAALEAELDEHLEAGRAGQGPGN